MGVIVFVKDPAVPLKPLDLLQWHLQIRWIFSCWIDPVVSLRPRTPTPQSHWNCGIRTLQTIISNFSANSKLYAIRDLGGIVQWKKNEGRKFLDTAPVIRTFYWKTEDRKSRETVALSRSHEIFLSQSWNLGYIIMRFCDAFNHYQLFEQFIYQRKLST
jgi:hypothetical protein